MLSAWRWRGVRIKYISIFDKINYDIEYVDNMSFLLDMKIVFMTIKSVLTKEGAELPKSGIKDELDQLKEHYEYVTQQLPKITEKDIKNYNQANA